MSSSTSSSESPLSTRATYLRILAVIVLGMGAALGLFRSVAFALDASADTILSRVMDARDALPRIVATDGDLVMVFGSSMVDAAFSARLFDRWLAEREVEVTSFNFGFGGLNPLFQDYLARRIRDAFEAEDRRLRLAILEFNPFQTTLARRRGARAAEDSFISMLATPGEMAQTFLDDPERGALLFTIHYLRGDISAEMTGSYFGGFLVPRGPTSDLEENEAVVERRRELGEILNQAFEEDYPDFSGADWVWEWQGAGTIPEERSEDTLSTLDEYYETVRTPKRMEDDRLRRIHCCDLLDLAFDEELIQAYVRIVRVFQQFSDHVEVVLLPRNTAWIDYEPEVRARLQAVLERIVAETGATVRDHQDIDRITPNMFSDTTHLARYSGDITYTRYLVDEYAPVLRRLQDSADP